MHVELWFMPDVKEHISGYQDWAKASGASWQTLRLRRHYLINLALATQPKGLHELTTADLLRFLGREGWSPETRKSARAAIRSFYRYAMDTELVTVDPSRKLPSVRIPIGQPKPAPEAIFEMALDRADQRGRLLLLLAGYAGLRRAEIASTHTRDIDTAGLLRITGKGGRERTVPLHPRILAELTSVRPGYLFPGQINGHLSPGRVGELIKHLLGAEWTAHTLRHRFASRAYSAQRDLLAVQELLGHSKPETTKRYTAIPAGALRAAVLAL